MAHIDLRAYCGADSNFLTWWSKKRIDGCLGYAAKRRVNGGAAEPLTAYVSFADGSAVVPNADGQPCTKWPFQRFTWSDFKHYKDTDKVEYQVLAMIGTAAKPVESDIVSDWVEPKPPVFGNIIPYFNFGTVSSRWFSKQAEHYPDQFRTLRKALAPRPPAGSPSADDALAAVLALPMDGVAGKPTIGAQLGGKLAPRIMKMLVDVAADPTSEIYAALFELSDRDLIAGLKKIGGRCHLILANGTHKNGKDENAAAAAALDGVVDLSRRMLHPDSVFAHNKFVVVVKNGSPAWAWTGSTNWSAHGLYTQSNNGLELQDAAIAEAFLQAWHRYRDAGDTTPPPPDPPAQEQYHFSSAGLTASVFLSPHKMTKATSAKSPDLVYANALIRGAKNGILSLMLDPGWEGSLLQTLRATAQANSDLYVRAVVNSDPSKHAKAGDATAVGFLNGHEVIPSNYDIVLPGSQAQPGEPIQDYLARVGIVVVHSKIIVIDPLGDHPVVMTGSHNMGVKAATKNDDNLVIIEGDPDLAVAYALNVISVFNHFWWRHNAAPEKEKEAATTGSTPAGPATVNPTTEWKGLKTTDAWQDKFYTDPSCTREVKFWGISA